MNSIIKVSGLGKHYRIGGTKAVELRHSLAQLLRFGGRRQATGEFWALKEVDFELQTGEVLGVIGRNGAGKSTLLKLLAQITAPSRGRIELWGRVASLLEVGTGFHPELTGRDNIFLNASILGMKKAEVRKQFDAIVDFSGVEAFIDTPIKKYSSGMRVRLAFAVAAHLDPEILLIDEVLSVGDAAFQEKCLKKMNEVAGSGRTILFVSHNMAAVESLCNRCLLLEGGQIYAQGAPAQVCHDYLKMVTSRPQLVEKKSSTFSEEAVQLYDPIIESYATKEPSIIRTGNRIQIRFKYYIPQVFAALKRVAFRLMVHDQNRQLLFVCDMDVQNHAFETLAGQGQVSCISEPVNLLGGKYLLDIRLNSALVKHKVKNFAQFDILEGDYFGSSRTLKKKTGRGIFAISSQWTKH
ncbi:MAG: ABC transporter ATP-binding protein [Bacteroidota bacterium]